MKRTYENCTLRKKAIKEGIRDCGTDNGKCIGYADETEEPHDICKECKNIVGYDEEAEFWINQAKGC